MILSKFCLDFEPRLVGFAFVSGYVLASTFCFVSFVEWTSKELKENIAIGHMINPSIMGVKTAGQLGNTTEIQDSYSIFEKNVVMPEREELELVFNDLVHIFGIKNEVSINEWAIIDGIIKQNEEE